MAKRNQNNGIDGFINLNKAAGISSHTAMGKIRRLLDVKAGHAGTLDPAAWGVLPLCLGKATRLAEYLVEGQKTYIGTVTLGIETDSYDGQGQVLEMRDAAWVQEADVIDVLPRFTGDILQKPPMVSALKREGKPLYQLAREGQMLDLAPRPVTIHSLRYLGGSFGQAHPVFEIEIFCSKGTYIRSLAHDIGQALGTVAHLSALCRKQVGLFHLADALTVEEIAARWEAGDKSFILPMTYPLGHLPLVVAEPAQYDRLLHGNEASLPAEGWTACPVCRVEDAAGRLLGIGQIRRTEEAAGFQLKLNKVFAEMGGANERTGKI